MALIGYTITVVAKQDNPYNVLPETDISIRKNSDNTLVNIYADEAGLVPIAQLGAKTDSNGQFTFYADASLGVLKAVWTNGGVIATEVLDQSDHSRLANRSAVGAHDAIYRRETTVAEIATGVFSVGDKLTVTDRANAHFDIVSGGTADGYGVLDAGVGKTAVYNIIVNDGDPRGYGAKANSPSFDSHGAVMAAIANLKICVKDNSIYDVSDEVIIPSSCQITCLGNSGFRAKSGSNFNGKAVVRASKKPIGETPDMNDISQQVRTINQSGRLLVDANGIADYGFYARGVVVESQLDFIYAYGAKKSAISFLTCWFSMIKTGLLGLNSGHNVVIGHALSGETGDIFVNGMNFPTIMSYRALGSPSYNGSATYDPLSATLDDQLSGCGVILGKGFALRSGVIVSQACEGTGVATTKAVGWTVGAMYLEANSKLYTTDARISFLGTTGNDDASSITIDAIHLDANQKILTRNTRCKPIVGNIYRYDNVQTFHPSCADNSIRLVEAGFTLRNAYADIPPDCIIMRGREIDFSITGRVSSAPTESRLKSNYVYRKGVSVRLKVKLSQALASPITIRIGDNTSYQEFSVTDSIDVGLSDNRTHGSWYSVTVGTTTATADVVASINIVRQTEAWGGY